MNYETHYKDLQAFGEKPCCAMSILSSGKGQSRARQVATRRKKYKTETRSLETLQRSRQMFHATVIQTINSYL